MFVELINFLRAADVDDRFSIRGLSEVAIDRELARFIIADYFAAAWSPCR